MPTRVAWKPQQLALFSRMGPKGRRPARAKPPAALERQTAIALADRLRLAAQSGWWWSYIGNGEKRSARTGGLLKRLGLRPGLPDYLFIGPRGDHRWLELKRRGRGRISETQLEFAELCRQRDIKHAICFSFDEAESVLRDWGVLH